MTTRRLRRRQAFQLAWLGLVAAACSCTWALGAGWVATTGAAGFILSVVFLVVATIRRGRARDRSRRGTEAGSPGFEGYWGEGDRDVWVADNSHDSAGDDGGDGGD